MIEDGYELDIGNSGAGDFTPQPGRIMYCVHSSQPFVNSGYTIRTEEVVDSLKEKGFDVGIFADGVFLRIGKTTMKAL